jgi:hypothetical protein
MAGVFGGWSRFCLVDGNHEHCQNFHTYETLHANAVPTSGPGHHPRPLARSGLLFEQLVCLGGGTGHTCGGPAKVGG